MPEEGIAMGGQIRLNPKLLLERMQEALNDHDVDALVDCCDPFYYSEQPVHPDRAFRGQERMRSQWSAIFKRVPDFKSELVRYIAGDDMVWAEVHWHGKRIDGRKLDMRGVAILGVRENRLIWSRLYVEPLQAPGGGIEAIAE